MGIELNHTIVHARDKGESANFYAEILGLPKPQPFGIFQVVDTSNGVSLDFVDCKDPVTPQHYAFLITDKEFDEIFDRIKARGLKYWADPAKKQEGEINYHFGGRGVYFTDPSGHFLEIITRPYERGNK